MNKRLIFMIVILLAVMMPLTAQDEPTAAVSQEQDADAFVLRVVGDSVHIRALPTRDSDFIGSTFENDNLVAVGRNIDGSWFEVRRPGRQNSAGWISEEWVTYMFDVSQLPITDLTTGITGAEPVYDTGYSVHVLVQATLRNRPHVNGDELMTIPVGLTIPLIERSPDDLWLFVNYLGNTGWVAEFLLRPSVSIRSLPISAAYALNTLPVEIIPVEVQLAQVNRLRDFITPRRDLATSIANFWEVLGTGEVVPCNPPEAAFTHYPWTPRDVVELPELRRHVRRLERAVDDLNASITTMQRCGVYTESEISSAYAQAINSRVIFNAILGALDNLEENVIR